MFTFDTFKIFLYYKDLEAAKHFYRDILNLQEYKESEHIWQYKITPDSYIGLVADGHGYFRAMTHKPVMPAIHLAPGQPLEDFFEYLKANGVKMLDDEVRMFSSIAKVFLAEDPEGHVLEFIQRLE
jgi:catechol 2,3-dioxygenase-like lactoylglutathione lyase family enzyme